jgi:hypothetical protein
MDQITRDALESSIKHWQENVAVTSFGQATIGPHDCALCNLFNVYEDKLEERNCIGCPVRKATGQRYCCGSPFEKVCSAHRAFQGDDANLQEFRDAAQAELDFLISLRPAEASPSTPS